MYDLTPGEGYVIELSNSSAANSADDLLFADAFLLVEDPNAVEGVTEIFADNTSAHVSVTGAWNTNLVVGYQWLNDFRAAGVGVGEFTWNKPLLTEPGRYRVHVRWRAHTSYPWAAQFRVHHAGGTDTVSVDQRRNGSRWIPLGEYDLETGTGPLVQAITETSGIIVDGIRLVRLDGALPHNETVVDNADPLAIVTGAWTTWSTTTGQTLSYVGNNLLFTAAGDGSATVTWPFAPTAPGRYRVWTRWTTHPNRATDAPYAVHHDGGVTTVRVNQEISGERWMSLGTFNFSPGGTAKVVLSNLANEYVIADAIRFEQAPHDAMRTVAADAVRFATNNAEAASVRYVHADHLSLPRA